MPPNTPHVTSRYTSYDGAELAYRVLEAREPDAGGRPVICLAGGPGRDAAYLGDLGGLDARHPLVVPDGRGTGASPPAPDPSGYAFPALAEDAEALRAHLGLDRFALLAHDAACATAQAYAALYPHRLTHLVLATPGSRLQGELPGDAEEIFESRADEDWWVDAYVAAHSLTDTHDFAEARALLRRAAPLAYARWDAPQQAHAATEDHQLHPVPRIAFWQGVDDPARLALLDHLRAVTCPVLVVTGDRDAVTGMRAGELVAASFPRATVRPLYGVGHYPWVDEPEMFRPVVEEFLASRVP
ncbi:alpha/beta hydrolase [Streptomyces sp. AV19]|uniref:alpha/beta fold hydrolase n=1 Tax=Streptomyces sp. AV19 TaxID=2793068 RepID=UPI0018FF0D18|nr:alpha/beta hydrolase [Streptomyces sp. AV19]MBH1932828.1 alpha/beta hydrolase [Streptomyces sp. AV19]MDG4531493.1 alpha/beta hydrolase [Streptomyces sp. AV19]